MGNTLTFVASRRKALPVLIASICFVALGAWTASERPLLGWLMVAWFGLVILPLLVLSLLPSMSMYLRLDEEGLEMVSLLRRYKLKLKWSDVADFRMRRSLSTGGLKCIVIIFHPEYKQRRGSRALAAALSGMEASIGNQYDATLEQILEALTAWRHRYGRRNA
jgi:hypothetical protein